MKRVNIKAVVGWLVVWILTIAYMSIAVFAIILVCDAFAHEASRNAIKSVSIVLGISVPCLHAWWIVKQARGKIRWGLLAALIVIAGTVNWGLFAAAEPFFVPQSILFACAICSVFLAALVALHAINKTIAGHDPKGWYRMGFLVVLVVITLLLSIDTKPVPEIPHHLDVVSSWPGAEETREVLLTFYRGKDSPTIELDAPLVEQGEISLYTNTLEHAEEIARAWANAEKGRAVIEKLNSFDRITDLTVSTWTDPIIEIRIMSFMNYRAITRAYWAYARLLAAQGRHVEAAHELVTLFAFARKAVPDMHVLISRMVLVAIAKGTIDHAHAVAACPDCPVEALEILRNGFMPLDNDYFDFGHMALMEHVSFKSLFNFLLSREYENLPDAPASMSVIQPMVIPFRRLLYHPNRTDAAVFPYLQLIAAGTKEIPPDTESAKNLFNAIANRRYGLRNPLGQFYMKEGLISLSGSAEEAFKVKVRSELLWVYLHTRLGEDIELHDPFTGRPYLRDDKGLPLSVGPDGLPGTEDDILLYAR